MHFNTSHPMNLFNSTFSLVANLEVVPVVNVVLKSLVVNELPITPF